MLEVSSYQVTANRPKRGGLDEAGSHSLKSEHVLASICDGVPFVTVNSKVAKINAPEYFDSHAFFKESFRVNELFHVLCTDRRALVVDALAVGLQASYWQFLKHRDGMQLS